MRSSTRLFMYSSIAFLTLPAFATTFVVPSDRDMVRRADAIVVGAAVTSYAQLVDGRIETVTAFSVSEVIKGSILQSSIDVHEPGGRVGDRALFIAGIPRFEPGEQSILFLTRTPQGTWAVTDIVLGRFLFRTDQIGHKLAVRDEGEIVGWDPDRSVHREIRRDAARFLDFLRAEAVGAAGQTDYQVPTYPLRATTTSLQPRTNASPTALSYTFDINAGQGSRWNVFPSPVLLYTEPGTLAKAVTAVNAAIAAWDGDPNSNVNYSGGTDPCGPCHTNGLTGVPDNFNTVLFERDLTGIGILAFSCPGPGYSGVLGIGGITSASGTHSGPNGETFDTTRESDVEMNQGVLACAPFPQGDLNSSLTHEIGHTLGFRHADQTRADDPNIACSTDPLLECATTAIMKSFITLGLNAVLTTYDQHAVGAVYPCSLGGGCLKRKNDFDGDGKSDILWRNTVSGINYLYFMNGFTVASQGVINTVADPNWTIAGTGDFDGDGKADIVWRNTSTGDDYMYLMNGRLIKATGYMGYPVATAWQIVGIGDFDGDGKSDVLWRNSSTGEMYLYLMNGMTVAASGFLPTIADLNWKVVGVADFNGDGKADILWRYMGTGVNSGINYIWLMNGFSVASQGTVNTITDMNWQVVGTADFDGDGKADILWRNGVTGDDYMYIMNGYSIASQGYVGYAVADPNWKIVAVGDYDGDGKADILWRNSATGDDYMYLMNGRTVLSTGYAGSAQDPTWNILP